MNNRDLERALCFLRKVSAHPGLESVERTRIEQVRRNLELALKRKDRDDLRKAIVETSVLLYEAILAPKRG